MIARLCESSRSHFALAIPVAAGAFFSSFGWSQRPVVSALLLPKDKPMWFSLIATALLAVAPERGSVATDSADVVAVVARFHAALGAGDSTTALTLLAPDVMILETGGVETREQYRSGHLRGDITFARSVQSTRAVTQVRVDGNTAWVVSTSVTQGESNGRQVNSTGAELMVLRKTGGVWQIAAIHWSSRSRR